MKKALMLVVVAFMMFSCSQDKKAKLDKLRKDHDKISAEIKSLEAELASSSEDSTNTLKTKVTVTDIKKSEFYHYIDVQGKVDGDENIAVSAQILGVVSKIYVKEGDAVKKDQVLAEIDASVMKQGIEELKSSLEFVKEIYEKQKSLWDQKIGSEVQYLQAKNNKESLENKLKTLEEQLKMTQIKSPIDGTVEELPIRVGQAISPGINAMRVVNFRKIKVVAEVAEAFTAKIKQGNNVIVNFPDLEKDMKATIMFTSKFINPINRTFTIEIRLDPSDFEYRANMIAVVKIIDYSAKDAVVLPINLIQSDNKGKFVMIAQNEAKKNIAKKILVTTGQSYNGQIEVLTGLKEGDKIIIIGYQNLEDGMLLDI